MLKLYRPYPDPLISQPFDRNDNPSYAGKGLRGHTAIDYGVSWGSPIRNCAPEAYCYAVKNSNDPDPTQYRAVYTLVEDGDKVWEVSYGHCSTMNAEPGKIYYDGEIIAHVGNTGAVYSGGIAVSKDARLKGSKKGSHLHFQVRAVTRVTKTKSGRSYLNDGRGLLKLNGYYFEYTNPDNGYNSCVDPAQFFVEETAEQVGYRREVMKKQIPVLSTIVSLYKKLKGVK